MKQDLIRYKNIASVIAVLVLLFAIPDNIWPYGYFVLLRWVVTGVALFVLWTANELKMKKWLWLMAIIAILFNPIAPFHLDKATWQIIDFVAAGIFLLSIFKVKVYALEK